MLNVYAKSFLEATRFTSHTQVDPRTQRHLDETTARRVRHAWFWQRRPYWV